MLAQQWKVKFNVAVLSSGHTLELLGEFLKMLNPEFICQRC